MAVLACYCITSILLAASFVSQNVKSNFSQLIKILICWIKSTQIISIKFGLWCLNVVRKNKKWSLEHLESYINPVALYTEQDCSLFFRKIDLKYSHTHRLWFDFALVCDVSHTNLLQSIQKPLVLRKISSAIQTLSHALELLGVVCEMYREHMVLIQSAIQIETIEMYMQNAFKQSKHFKAAAASFASL